MKIFSCSSNCALALGASVLGACAQTLNLTKPVEPPADQVSLSARFGFNIGAKFKNLGGFTSIANPGPATGGAEHFYDDGFVRVDASNNAGGKTWFWGYDNAGQVRGDSLEMHAGNVSADQAVKGDSDPQLGFELTYARQLGDFGTVRWGVEAAFGFTDITIHNNESLTANVTALTDVYQFGGIMPPVAPYAGSFAGPGPIIGDTPARSTTILPGGAVIAGDRHLDASLYTLRLGPYVSVPLTRQLSLQFGGGFALAVVESEFNFNEAVTVGGATAARAGRSSDSDILPGAYLDAQVSWAFTDHFGVFAGGQYQYLTRFSQRAAGKEAELDFDKTFFLTAGLRFNF